MIVMERLLRARLEKISLTAEAMRHGVEFISGESFNGIRNGDDGMSWNGGSLHDVIE